MTLHLPFHLQKPVYFLLALLLRTLLYCIINTPKSYHLHSPFSISILAVNSPKSCETLGVTETPHINILGYNIKTINNTSTKICTNDPVFLQAIPVHAGSTWAS
jgi:hypothetical protein